MIRERGHSSCRRISIGLHAAVATALALATAGWSAWSWTPVFVLAGLRAWLAPSRTARSRPIPPKTVGLAEVPLLLLVIACAV